MINSAGPTVSSTSSLPEVPTLWTSQQLVVCLFAAWLVLNTHELAGWHGTPEFDSGNSGSSSSSLLTHTLGHCEEVRPTTSSLLFRRVRVTEFPVSVEKARRRRWYRFQRPHGEPENSHSGWHRGTINTETHVPMCSHPQSKRELFICAFCFDLTWPERDNVPTTSRPEPRFPGFLQSIHTQTPFQCVCANDREILCIPPVKRRTRSRSRPPPHLLCTNAHQHQRRHTPTHSRAVILMMTAVCSMIVSCFTSLQLHLARTPADERRPL